MMKKILLVEDEFFMADLYKRILEKGGFEVTVAINGLQGFELANQGFDLILLDIMLPKLNGLQLLKKLKTEQPLNKTPVVLLSNLGQANIIKEAYELGAQGYFLKVSLKPQELIKQVNLFLQDPQYKMDFHKLAFD